MSLIFVSKASVWSGVTLGEKGLRRPQRGRKDWVGTEKEEGLGEHREGGGTGQAQRGRRSLGGSQRGRRIYGTKTEETLGAQSGRRVWEEYSKGGPGGREGGVMEKHREEGGTREHKEERGSGEHREGGRV